VDFVGYVTTDALHQHFGQARVFCLLSRCESFGIPAVEAQAFGTPSVVADCCAPPEIAGPGGVVVPSRDIEATTDALQRLLTDEEAWRERSAAARGNAVRFQWALCSMPLVGEWRKTDAS
jgi:glycosyltransferase involved in cell wall biosynthesis